MIIWLAFKLNDIFRHVDADINTNNDDILDASIDQANLDTLPTSKNSGKLFVSLTIYTTVTITSYAVNKSTTVGLSISCVSPYSGTQEIC